MCITVVSRVCVLAGLGTRWGEPVSALAFHPYHQVGVCQWFFCGKVTGKETGSVVKDVWWRGVPVGQCGGNGGACRRDGLPHPEVAHLQATDKQPKGNLQATEGLYNLGSKFVHGAGSVLSTLSWWPSGPPC